MSESAYRYVPTVWIDSSNQDDVFVQGKSLSQRSKDGQIREQINPPELQYSYIEEDTNYFFNYEYGFVNPENRFLAREKYIKTRIQRKDHPELEMEQVLYRPNRSADHFNMSVALIENGIQVPFISCRYIGPRYVAEKILKFPCKVVTPIDDTFSSHSGIVYREHSYSQQEQIRKAIERGEEQLSSIHMNELGSYTSTVPTHLDKELTENLLEYFNSPTLPAIEEGNITPESLEFFIDLRGRS